MPPEVLIIRPGALGDTLMLAPGLLYLRGKALVTFVGRRPGLDFIRDVVPAAMDFERAGWHRLFFNQPHPEGLPVSRTDLAIAFLKDTDGRVRNNLKTHFPSAPVHVFPAFPDSGRHIHTARYLSDCLQEAGLTVDPHAAMTAADQKPLLGTAKAPLKRKHMVFHPGSGGPEKTYPPEYWIELMNLLCREQEFRKLKPVVLLGPAEEAYLSRFYDAVGPLGGEIFLSPDKGALIELLCGALLYAGHDSGITHLAAMLGTPTIALFSKSDEIQWRPLGPRVRVIKSEKVRPTLNKEIFEAATSLARPGPG